MAGKVACIWLKCRYDGDILATGRFSNQTRLRRGSPMTHLGYLGWHLGEIPKEIIVWTSSERFVVKKNTYLMSLSMGSSSYVSLMQVAKSGDLAKSNLVPPWDAEPCLGSTPSNRYRRAPSFAPPPRLWCVAPGGSGGEYTRSIQWWAMKNGSSSQQLRCFCPASSLGAR
jgi:hypothetical protein